MESISTRTRASRTARRFVLKVFLVSVIALLASASGHAQTRLNSGQAWQGIIPAGQWRHFFVDIARNHSQLDIVFNIRQSSGDGDVYVRYNQIPNLTTYDLVKTGNARTDLISLTDRSNPQLKNGRYYVSIYAKQQIQARITADTPAFASKRSGMGAKPYNNKSAATFRVWAPNANSVHVAGQFNSWNSTNIPLINEGNGIWSFDVRGVTPGQQYLYVIRNGAQTLWKPDPYEEQIVNSVGNSIIFDDDFQWTDSGYSMPSWNSMVIYQMHVGTFNDTPGGAPGTFDTAIQRLDYLNDLGINAIKLLPVFEFPGDYSWGYNPSHPFAIETAYGGPSGLKRLINQAHNRGIAVLLDVVYNHLGPTDLSLWKFDGWSQGNYGGIYFYQDNRSQTPWGDTRPDFGRGEVRQYLRDNAMTLLNDFRADGFRFDSVLNIRVHNGGDNPDGWSLVQWINNEINATQPWKISIAEDLQNNSWITKSTGEGGAGFDSQWTPNFVHPIRNVIVPGSDDGRDMNVVKSSLESRYNGDAFQSIVYTESHDEVANGRSRVAEEVWPGNAGSWWSRKRSTLGGALVMTAPGIPMIFQGQEILEDGYFQDTDPVDWNKLTTFSGIHLMYRDLIRLRRNWFNNTRGLRGQQINVFHVNDTNKVIAFHRWDQGGAGDDVIVVSNFRNENRPNNYRIGLPRPGIWKVRFNSDWSGYSSDFGNLWVPDVTATSTPWNGLPYSGTLPIPAYSTIILSQD